MGNGIPEGFNCLARYPAIAAGLNKRHRGHEGEANVASIEKLINGKERGFRIERIEDGLNQQEIDSAIDQTTDLLVVDRHQFVIGGAARRRIVDIG